ncbi:MAG: hypothetical protein IPH13_15060 [Planctomycetes bacterium]|nr:hypothetical protein [Planctomycetota bacterium]
MDLRNPSAASGRKLPSNVACAMPSTVLRLANVFWNTVVFAKPIEMSVMKS